MTISARYVSQITCVDTITGPYVGSDNTVTLDGLNQSVTLDGTTSPAATKMTGFQKTLIAGNGTIDLLALPGLTVDEIVNCNALKVQVVKLRNLVTNLNTITVVPGGANPYNLFGATFKVILAPGQEILAYLDAAAPVANSTVRNIDCNGVGNQILEVFVVAG